MCRLYALLANQPTKVECTLIHAQNALMIQSRADMRGVSHTDGWGIAYYANGHVPTLVKRDTAAFQDLHFPVAVERAYAHTIVAHVRKATVGKPSVDNTHPFTHGPWVFAHNGTLAGFRQQEARLQQETIPRLLARRRGSTDSEMAFYWLLSRMHRAGIDPESPCRNLPGLAELLQEAVRELAGRCQEIPTDQETRLNFLLTDGRILLVSRWNNSLYWVERPGVMDCEICGIPHIHLEGESAYQATVVASEPISEENWQAVPDRSLVVVDQNIEARIQTIASPPGSIAAPAPTHANVTGPPNR